MRAFGPLEGMMIMEEIIFNIACSLDIPQDKVILRSIDGLFCALADRSSISFSWDIQHASGICLRRVRDIGDAE